MGLPYTRTPTRKWYTRVSFFGEYMVISTVTGVTFVRKYHSLSNDNCYPTAQSRANLCHFWRVITGQSLLKGKKSPPNKHKFYRYLKTCDGRYNEKDTTFDTKNIKAELCELRCGANLILQLFERKRSYVCKTMMKMKILGRHQLVHGKKSLWRALHGCDGRYVVQISSHDGHYHTS